MNRNAIFALVALLAGMLACAVPAGMTPTPVVITQIVVVPNEQEPVQASPTLPLPTLPPPTVSPPTFTLAPMNTNTAVSTTTPVPIATLSGPVAIFVKEANCRAGPGTGYEVVTSVFKGDAVQIVGRNPNYNNTWWYIIIPSGGKCWVSLTTAQAYGDFDAIPTVKP
jgi:hypothetical protein